MPTVISTSVPSISAAGVYLPEAGAHGDARSTLPPIDARSANTRVDPHVRTDPEHLAGTVEGGAHVHGFPRAPKRPTRSSVARLNAAAQPERLAAVLQISGRGASLLDYRPGTDTTRITAHRSIRLSVSNIADSRVNCVPKHVSA